MIPWARIRRDRLALITFAPILLLLALVVFFPPQGKEGAQSAQFIGRFHPLTVHFPIALLLLVPVLEIAGRWDRFSYLRASARFVLGLATLASFLAAILGWCLARTGSYSGPTVTQHMWGGATLVLLCWACWILRGQPSTLYTKKLYAAALTIGVVAVSWTGYRGGQISQGEDHLTEYMPSLLRHAIGLSAKAPLLRADSSGLYMVRVQPIFTEQCIDCHGPKKQKGKLRLDSYGWLMRGGKHGAVIRPGNAADSELFRRITLSPDHDDFMPKEKKQPLSADQLKVIELWIVGGASGTTPVEAIRNLQTGVSVAAAPVEVTFPEIDAAAVAKARESIASLVLQLQEKYPNILNYESRGSAELVLNASLLSTRFSDADVAAFAPVAEHITIADFSRTSITDKAASEIDRMKHLRVLRLSQTKITDATVTALRGLDELQSLNVYDTAVTSAALPMLQKFPRLRRFNGAEKWTNSSLTAGRQVAGRE